ncbi:hypothetical protein NLI96_g3153 [Meripilus lineatus]|uniref:Transmembrane protein n=1 Tax=Meripilus lineatus TaxID=2056292 RepID=A0AAD5V9C3_9APHY|nr:hypothetical protein NLI96_g3153 [Physisporinus lineatus]
MRCWPTLIGALFVLVLSQLAFAQTEAFSDSTSPTDSLEGYDNDTSTTPLPVANVTDIYIRPVISSATSITPSPSSTPPLSSSGSHSLFISAPPSSSKSANRTRSHVTTNRPHTQSVFVGTRSFPHDRPPPATTRPPSPPPAAQQNSTNQPSRQPVVAIVFEVIAGVAGIFILISISRCIYSWKRTPSRDRIAGLLSRHQLDREMAELEREQMERRRRQWRRNSVQGPPPPPYQRAPSYETLPIHGEDHV